MGNILFLMLMNSKYIQDQIFITDRSTDQLKEELQKDFLLTICLFVNGFRSLLIILDNYGDTHTK